MAAILSRPQCVNTFMGKMYFNQSSSQAILSYSPGKVMFFTGALLLGIEKHFETVLVIALNRYI